ncbi:hypothetical protein DMR_31860 [Solidesulfovibrio magneticus RS-1]|uniref:Uncharacterized protein n=1 Tax=Solidesulfovibrio magneticus (strain ATCC 700980 / DSM 13731 / RS-1) TaxID=573370 RepID=C4XJC7_SOLM1|nr:hypothetical protein DMR_31860 [Solidesulfovibrio magneticus RS-1]
MAESVVEMQTDIEGYFHHYNHERPHQGRGMNGRAPCQVLLEGIPTIKGGSGEEPMEAA